MKIQTLDRDIRELLTSGYFKIPRFQRPYRWEVGEVEDFWNDTIIEADKDYFIGAIVLYTWTKGTYGIVDGQQRLTTIAMTLCALRNLLRKEGFQDLADGVHGLLERKDIDNRLRFIIQTETSYPFLQEHILKKDPTEEAPATPSTEEQRLQKAFGFLTGKLANVVKTIRSDANLSTDAQTRAIEKKLLDIRDRVLSLKVISTNLETEDDAYTIFETLNTRGMDLTITDLVRTLVTRLLVHPNRDVDRPKDRFNEMIRLFETSAADISTNSFLHHYWLSRHEYTTEKKLYKAIKKIVRTKNDAKELLSSLETDAKCYRCIHEPSFRNKWRIEQIPLRDSLSALNLFRVRQQVPFVLAVMREYDEGALGLKLAKKALLSVENFHFVFTAVTSQRSSGGISFMYALHARQLQKADTSAKRTATIDELIAKLQQKLPPYEEFVANFRGLLCSEAYTKRKELVRYVLRRFAENTPTGIAPDWNRMTIEHIASQSKGSKKDLTDEQVAEIGNLLLVSEDLNRKLDSKSFVEKKKLLKTYKLLDDVLGEQAVWGAAEIRKRTDFMADLAFKKIWKI